ncbi:receptor-type tyrosine-protein phosphatase H-like isoform X3 [Centroberyx affinis]|uniref:receptor-type tyrosine-protein phosphatase H-like isoform X3 n=1 Tax=Centroberyx affinis TaxID=166261 RepID=UPI003A5C0422
MMKYFKIDSVHLLLCLFLTSLWCPIEPTSTSVPTATTAAATTTTSTPPENVQKVTVLGQNETSITLQWEKVANIVTYRLHYNDNDNIIMKDVTAPDEGASVEYVVSSLTAATEYNFTLFTVFEGINSTGHQFAAFTAPENVKNLMALRQSETSITLRWDKVANIPTYTLQYNGNEINITVPAGVASGEYVVSPLTAQTEYDFTLLTVFGNVPSSGERITAVTAPENVKNLMASEQNETSITLRWDKVADILTYTLQYNGKDIDITVPAGVASGEYVVSPLTAQTEYDFTLLTVFGNVPSSGERITAVTAPENVQKVTVLQQTVTSITLQWDTVANISKYRLQYNDNDTIITASNASVQHTVSSLTAQTKYDFTLYTVFESAKSSGARITAVTTPENVQKVTVLGRNETSISLQWDKVANISTYTLQYNDNDNIMNINASDGAASVEHVVSSLTAGTEYNFVVVVVFENVSSSGLSLTAVTVPLKVASVRVIERSVTSAILKWDKMHVYTYLLEINGDDVPIDPRSSSSDVVTFRVSSLSAGTKYPFNLSTVFFEVKSTAYTGFIITAIDCAASPWHVTNSSIQGRIEGLFSNATATNGSGLHLSPVGADVSFTDLYPGSTYEVSLFYDTPSERLLQCNHMLPIIPPDINAHCDYWAAGYSILIRWDVPEGVWTGVEVNVTGDTYNVSRNGKLETQISGFQPAKVYKVSLATLSGPLRSKSLVFDCRTDPRGVIAGAVLGVLLFCILVCLAVFIWRRNRDFLSQNKNLHGGTKPSRSKSIPISVEKFPDHFRQMSADQNRGFSEEYESFMAVGTEQTRKTAEIPDNKAKNRFTNVLPYDWSRVKLTSVNHSENSDYINANYMPGYNSNRQYIAAQGPLPSTVNDFWRMIWEQRVKGVVMVTNCTEGGRAKCEQYWPLDCTPCLFGELLVTVQSEQREPDWTLREFGVKNKQTSEERTVKHFHFTAWPDHGVPEGTEALIWFRGLVRQHIENEGDGAPTVVHCSAGVGRTGTIIALDVLLQQLEAERAVGIAAFVQKIRQSRPLMVQTESQYVFLHQCIMNSLQLNQKPEENIYENSDMIYANATALREFHSNNTNP